MNRPLGPTAKSAVRSLAEGIFISALVIGLLVFSGVVETPRDRVRSSLQASLGELRASFSEDVGSVSALTVWLASELSHAVSSMMSSRGLYFSDLRDSPDLLADIQRFALPHLLFTMSATKCSGAYFFLFTTANSRIAPEAGNGAYVKFDSILSQVTIDRPVAFFRGDPSVSRERGVYLHGSWQMQCEGKLMDELKRAAMLGGDRPTTTPRPYFLSRPCDLPDTWESVRLWGAPVLDMSSGSVIGVCGFELSDMYFSHLYPPTDTVSFALSDGPGDERTIERTINAVPYISAQETISIGSGRFAEEFNIAAMMPRAIASRIIDRAAIELMLVFAGIAAIASGALFLARYLITRSIQIALKEILERKDERSQAPLPEIDDLWEFLAALDQQQAAEREISSAPAPAPRVSTAEQIEEFKARVASLTAREQEVFGLYASGKRGREILEELHITQNTLKYHNRNIYSKLEVSSRNEMMALIEAIGHASPAEAAVQR